MELRGRCSRAQQQLEEAMTSLMKTERQLKDNASEVRGQVQSLMSRQQEALRCRELWLLGQIEILEQLKSEGLQQQLLNMNTLRAQVDLISEQLGLQPISSELRKHLDDQLTTLLSRLSALSLSPDDSPDLCFHGDTRSLRSAITSFGAVTSSSPGPAPKRQKTEGALSQWLLGAEPQPVAKGYHSSEPRDWLATNSQPQTVVPPLVTFDLFSSWGQLCDLKAWLVKEATPLPTCGPAFERRRSLSCSTSSSFEEIDQSELSGDELDQSEAEPGWGAVLRPFSQRWDSSDWLLPRCRSAHCLSEPQEIENLGLTLGRLRCLKNPAGGAREQTAAITATPTGAKSPTKNQDQTTPAARGHDQATPTAARSPGPNQDQTENQEQTQRSRAEALEAWLQKVAPVSRVCKANEPCSSLRHCLCEENCGRDALRHWLLQREGRDKNGHKAAPAAEEAPPAHKDDGNEKATPAEDKATPTKKAPLSVSEREQKVQEILEAWLHPLTSGPAPSVSMETACPFLRPLQAEQWVLSSPANQSPEPSPGLAHSAEAEDKWLLRKRSGAQERAAVVCDLFSCLKLNKDKEQWLHSATLQM